MQRLSSTLDSWVLTLYLGAKSTAIAQRTFTRAVTSNDNVCTYLSRAQKLPTSNLAHMQTKRCCLDLWPL